MLSPSAYCGEQVGADSATVTGPPLHVSLLVLKDIGYLESDASSLLVIKECALFFGTGKLDDSGMVVKIVPTLHVTDVWAHKAVRRVRVQNSAPEYRIGSIAKMDVERAESDI